MAAFLAKLAPLEAWPEMGEGVVITPQANEMTMHMLLWKMASDSCCKLAGR